MPVADRALMPWITLVTVDLAVSQGLVIPVIPAQAEIPGAWLSWCAGVASR